jgi:CMP-N-acetylneuraminic acid synthetase
MKTRIVAVIPMRHESKRVPGKNYRVLGDRPLYHHIAQTLLRVGQISQVVIDTDSELIRVDAARNFPQIKVLIRPQHLRADTVPMNDVLMNSVNQLEADLYLQTHSTNPLLSAGTISQGIERFLDTYPMYDSLFSVTRIQSRLWDSLSRPVNHNPAILLRTQDLPPIYEENSCLYLFTKQTLQQQHNRIGVRPMMLEICKREAIDIDEEEDFQIAEMMYRAKPLAA